MDFRMYFLDAKGHIQAARSFSETSYAEAIDFAELLYSLCDDVFMGYEVWRGSAIIYEGKNSPGQPKETLAEVCERRQRLVVEMEEALMDSFSCVRSSKKLLQELDAFKERALAPARDRRNLIS